MAHGCFHTGQRLVMHSVIIMLLALPVEAYGSKKKTDSRRFEVMRLKSGIVLPYPLDNVFRGFARCRRGRHTHRALDIGGVGPQWGIGTPLRAMARSRIIHIGRPSRNPGRYGRLDKRAGRTKRGGKMLPRSKNIPGYGRVYFFTKDYGRARTGLMMTFRVLSGRLKGYTIRYLHMSAIHPSLKKGDIVEAGQEVGLMGGTAVQTDAPHLHLDIANRRGNRIDIGRLFGIGTTIARCRRGKAAAWAVRKRYTYRARDLMRRFAREREKTRNLRSEFRKCGRWKTTETFKSNKVMRHRLEIGSSKRRGELRIKIQSNDKRYKPKLVLRNGAEKVIYGGTRARSHARRAYKMRRISNGRRGGVAEIKLKPGRRNLILNVGHWGRKRPPKGAKYTLTVHRRCR